MNAAAIHNGGQGNGDGNSYMLQNGGTLNVSGDAVIGFNGAGTNIFSQVSGPTTVGGNFHIANGAGSTGVATVTGGTLAVAGHFTLNSGASSILNLNGGTTSTGGIYGVSPGIVNFNGGTLIASSPAIGFPSLVSGVNGIVGTGGAIIDTGGLTVPMTANLGTTTNTMGLNTPVVALASGGSGYIGVPAVKVTGGGGTGASAVATISPSTGMVTGVTITSPGAGYTSAPTFTFSGGGGTGASASAYAPSSNSSSDGGLTKLGSGTLQLSGSNTYTGPTHISAGTLQVRGTGAPITLVNPNFNFHVPDNGNFQYSPPEPAGGWNYISDGGTTEGAGVAIPTPAAFNANGAVPVGNEVAFLQKAGAVQQSVVFPSDGTYTLSFYTEQRLGGNSGNQMLDVYLDTPNDGDFMDLAPSGVTPDATWEQVSFTFNESAGAHLLSLLGLATSDSTAFITGVALNAAYTGGMATNAIPDASAVVVADNATFDLNNSIETIGSLTGTVNGNVNLGSGTLTTGGDNKDARFSGAILAQEAW